MNNIEVHFSSKSNEWQTPPELFAILNDEFNFNLDAASTHENALCKNHFTIEDNALVKDWSKYGNVWVNPPYGRELSKFFKKAYEESLKGITVVMLVPARTDTRAMFDYCRHGEIRFIKGRLKFINKAFPSWRDDGNFKVSPAPFPSMIVVFGPNNPACVKFVDQKMKEIG